MHQQSLKVENERKAKSLALQIYNSFNFAKYETSIIEEVKFDDVAKLMLKKRLRKYQEKYQFFFKINGKLIESSIYKVE